MPFTYDLTLGASIEPDDQLEFESWIDDVWGRFHRDPVAFASLRGIPGNGRVFTNGPCALRERAELVSGQTIAADTKLGTAVADGESIPYGKPYAVFRYDAGS